MSYRTIAAALASIALTSSAMADTGTVNFVHRSPTCFVVQFAGNAKFYGVKLESDGPASVPYRQLEAAALTLGAHVGYTPLGYTYTCGWISGPVEDIGGIYTP